MVRAVSATETPAPTEPDEAELASLRVELCEAAGRRLKEMQEARERRRAEAAAASGQLADVITAARSAGMIWSEISQATGLSRQRLNLIVARAEEV